MGLNTAWSVLAFIRGAIPLRRVLQVQLLWEKEIDVS